jgi:hypothetical protein
MLLFLSFVSSTNSENKRVEQVLEGGRLLELVGVGRWLGKGSRRMNTVQIMCIQVPLETVPGTQGEGMKENSGGVNSGMIHLIHCKNLCKCYI